MRKALALIVAMAVCVSLVGCGGKKTDADPPSGKEETAGSESKELFIAEGEDGTVLVVEKDGTPAEGYSVDADGNIVGSDGKVVVEAAKVANLPSKEQPDEPEKGQGGGSSGVESTPSGGSGNGDSGSSGSSGGSSGGGSSSSGSGSGGSSGGSSGGGGNSQQPDHAHNWQPVYETIEIPVYEQVCYTVCAACGEKFGINNTDEELDSHMIAHMKKRRKQPNLRAV